MTERRDANRARRGVGGGDLLSTMGLILNFTAIISMALWLSMAGDGSRSWLTMLAGTITIVLFAASIVCFAADAPE